MIEPNRLGCFVNETHLIEILYWSNFQWISSFNKNTLNEAMKKYSAIFKESKFIQFQNRGHCTIAVGTALELKAVLYSYRHGITTALQLRALQSQLYTLHHNHYAVHWAVGTALQCVTSWVCCDIKNMLLHYQYFVKTCAFCDIISMLWHCKFIVTSWVSCDISDDTMSI